MRVQGLTDKRVVATGGERGPLARRGPGRQEFAEAKWSLGRGVVLEPRTTRRWSARSPTARSLPATQVAELRPSVGISSRGRGHPLDPVAHRAACARGERLPVPAVRARRGAPRAHRRPPPRDARRRPAATARKELAARAGEEGAGDRGRDAGIPSSHGTVRIGEGAGAVSHGCRRAGPRVGTRHRYVEHVLTRRRSSPQRATRRRGSRGRASGPQAEYGAPSIGRGESSVGVPTSRRRPGWIR